MAHVREVVKSCDVVGWNELGTVTLQRTVAALEGWTSYMPGFAPGNKKASAAAAVSISWRTDMFDLLDSGSIVVTTGVAHITPTRVINYVLLRHKATGWVFYRINTHVVHHIEVGGRMRLRDRLPGQNARAKVHFLRLAAVTRSLGLRHPTIGGGDLNVDYLAEKALPPSERTPWFPYTLLGAVAKLPEPNHGTHGGRLIDWLWTVNVTVQSQTVLPHGSSDHNPVVSVIEIPRVSTP